MIDSFALLTPILLLGVMALAGFVGCEVFFPLITPDPPAPPANLHVFPDDAKVHLTWDDYPEATEFHVLRGTATGTVREDYPHVHTVLPTEVPYTDDDQVTNGTHFFYRVTAVVGTLESGISNEADTTPNSTLVSFVLAKTLGTPRTDFTGSAGMVIQVGPNPLTIKTLGRIVDSAQAGMHVVSIIDPATSQSVGSVAVDTATQAVGEFAYAPLAIPVTLPAGVTRFIVSQETTGVEFFDVVNTTVQTTNVASVLSGVFSDAATPFTPAGGAGHSYGPVDFQY